MGPAAGLARQPGTFRVAMKMLFSLKGKERVAICSERKVLTFIESKSTAPFVYEDNLTVAIEDQRPKARRHLLLFSKERIEDIDALAPQHSDLVKHMARVGKKLLHKERSAGQPVLFGFHQPPFHSVSHLHMHCLVPPFMPSWQVGAIRFPCCHSTDTLLIVNRPPGIAIPSTCGCWVLGDVRAAAPAQGGMSAGRVAM